MKKIFVTGTDTGVGKTHVTCALIRFFQAYQKKIIGLKPVASGAEFHEGSLKNEDALAIQTAMNQGYDYASINPFCFATPIAPHLAAEEANINLNVADILSAISWASHAAVDAILLEGAGGWCVPLNEQESFVDLAQQWADGVIMVVGMRLGCINHALLTAKDIQQSGIPLLGWVANSAEAPMSRYAENLRYLQKHINVPLLAELTYQQKEISDPTGTIIKNIFS